MLQITPPKKDITVLYGDSVRTQSSFKETSFSEIIEKIKFGLCKNAIDEIQNLPTKKLSLWGNLK